MPERTEQLGGEDQVRLLTAFLESDAVRNRPPGLQREQDALIRRACEEGEWHLALGLWCLMAFRSADAAGEAAGLLLGHYAELRTRPGFAGRLFRAHMETEGLSF